MLPLNLKVWLERAFQEEEISSALVDCVGDRAPGLDSYNFSFLKAGSDFLKVDFCKMHSEFHNRGRLNKELNATSIILIPKVPNPVELEDYRPIGLVGCDYKLLSMILAKKLKVVLSHPFQGAFVKGRKIPDGVLIAIELINSRRTSGLEGTIFKIDFEKAYDHVNWTFVDYMLGAFYLRVKSLGLIDDFKVCRNGDSISHL